jgi:(E)-4-hydroxy-3-methylbut-2-enyl-diphosphate synthase
VEAAVKKAKFDKDLNVALMGCAVNGPGEAAGADLGVSLGRGRAHLFKRGEVVRTVPEGEIVEAVLDAIATWDEEEPVESGQ